MRLPPLGLELAAVSATGLSDEDVDKVTHLNAMRFFHFDPFAALGGKQNCTVEALRSQVVGHDVAIKSQRREGEVRSGILASDLAKMAAASAE